MSRIRRSAIVAATLAAGLSWYVTTGTAPADAHPAGPPTPPVAPPEVVEEIPAEDAGRYRSHVTSIRPSVPGLEARIVGGQDKFEISWTGREPLVVEGYGSEPMIRMSAAGIEVNRRSPSSYLSGDRYAAITVPPQAGPGPPSWRPLESAGTISWYDHRAQWMRPERPAIVGDGTRGVTIFHWSVPARIGDRRISIRGALDWLPDPAAVRAERSDTSSPLLSAGLLAGVAALGAAAGVRLRRRIEKAL